MKEAEWAVKVLKNEIKVNWGEENLARAVAADVLSEHLGQQRGCLYCEKEVHNVDEKSYFMIKGNQMHVYYEGKFIGSFHIRRCPICGNRLE